MLSGRQKLVVNVVYGTENTKPVYAWLSC